jgi:hypothetical protein
VIKTIKFDKPSYRDSRGRNGFIQTHGIEIYDVSSTTEEDRDGSIMLSPVNSRGKVSEACRLSIAKSALPEIIAALQGIAGPRRDFDDVSADDRFYLRRIYDLIGQGSLERLVEAIEGYQFSDPTVREGYFNLEAEIYRRNPHIEEVG